MIKISVEANPLLLLHTLYSHESAGTLNFIHFVKYIKICLLDFSEISVLQRICLTHIFF